MSVNCCPTVQLGHRSAPPKSSRNLADSSSNFIEALAPVHSGRYFCFMNSLPAFPGSDVCGLLVRSAMEHYHQISHHQLFGVSDPAVIPKISVCTKSLIMFGVFTWSIILHPSSGHHRHHHRQNQDFREFVFLLRSRPQSQLWYLCHRVFRRQGLLKDEKSIIHFSL